MEISLVMETQEGETTVVTRFQTSTRDGEQILWHSGVTVSWACGPRG